MPPVDRTPISAPLAEQGLYELWQTEWCPSSHCVRQRLTELGIDFVARQVPAAREERTALRERTGTDTIPVLVAPDGRMLRGEDAILGHLDGGSAEPRAARAHRLTAEKVRRRYIEKEYRCSQPRSRSARRPSSHSSRRSSGSARS